MDGDRDRYRYLQIKILLKIETEVIKRIYRPIAKETKIEREIHKVR